MKKNITHTLAFVLIFAISFVLVHAQSGGQNTGSGPQGGQDTSGGTMLENPFAGTGNSLTDLLQTILEKIILPIGAIIAVLAFIFTGFSFVMARGNQTALDKAKRSLLYTSIGTAVLLGAWTIQTIISNTVDQLKR